MSNIKINTKELNEKIINLNSLISKLDDTLDKIDSKLKLLSYSNNTWYHSTSIELYNHYSEKVGYIKQLQESYKIFFESTNRIIEEYENLEKEISKKVEDIPSIKIV